MPGLCRRHRAAAAPPPPSPPHYARNIAFLWTYKHHVDGATNLILNFAGLCQDFFSNGISGKKERPEYNFDIKSELLLFSNLVALSENFDFTLPTVQTYLKKK